MKAKPKKKYERKKAVLKVPPQGKAVVRYQHVTAEPQDETLALIARAARDPAVDVPKMRELLNMKMEYDAMQRQQAFQVAMVTAQKEMEPIVRRAENKQTNSNYAKLEHISREIKPIYSKHGFSLTYTSKPAADSVILVGCWVLHEGGHKEFHELPGKIDDKGFKGNANKTELQGLGSLISYLRRYLTCMVFDVILINEDDDGNAAGGAKKQEGDAFVDRARAEAPAGPIIEGGDWDQRTVNVKGKLQQVAGGNEVTPAQAASYLETIMGKREHKKSRIDMINDNLPLVRALVKAGLGSTVTSLHALADKGA